MSEDNEQVDTVVDQPEQEKQQPEQEQPQGADAVEANADDLEQHEAEDQPNDKEREGLLRDLQKERQRRQELEQYYMQAQMQQQQQPPQSQDDTSDDELLTRSDLKTFKKTAEQEFMRKVMETSWVEDNPESVQRINEELPQLLTKRPELKFAIENSPNRYKAAAKFLDDYKPRRAAPKSQQRRDRPGSPQGVGKSAKIAEAASLMDMSDQEYEKWKASKRRRR